MMRGLFWAHREAAARQTSLQHIRDEQEARAAAEQRYQRGQISRRDFLRVLGLGAATVLPLSAAACDTPTGSPTQAPSTPQSIAGVRVVIIGAGLAGLRCAHVLAQHNMSADVYEASDRIGGRTFSDSQSFSTVVERGGEFISSEHSRVRKLAPQLGLELERVQGGSFGEGEDIYLIDGQVYTYDEANADWQMVWKAFRNEERAAPWLQTYASSTERGKQLDQISIPEWFDPSCPLSNPILAEFGPDSRFAKLCFTNAIAEYGGDVEDQPALNLLYILAWNRGNSLSPLPGTNGLYHIVGGNQQLAQKLAEPVREQIHPDKALLAVRGDANGPYECIFSDGTTVKADKLVLALPFRILRELDIDMRIWESLPPAKHLAIREMPMGTNAKIHLELAERTWGPDNLHRHAGRTRNLNGVLYTDPDDVQLLWDSAVPVESGPVTLTYFPGGSQGANLSGADPFGPAHPSDVDRILTTADLAFPGTRAAYTGNSLQSFWAASPWQKGAYSYWGIGDYTRYVGAAAESHGNIHFAGEHTSTDFSGYMEGALETGFRAAREILASV
jgi:monoamine oxidase